MSSSPHKIKIIAGPTASGKSARAIAIAQANNGIILNADATQCYSDLQILSARPDANELKQAEHRLYGIWSGDKMASVGDWLDAVKPEIEKCWQSGKLPIICGGTGFYIKALTEGLSPIPDIPPDIRKQIMQEIDSEGNSVIYDKLKTIDSESIDSIPEGNTQRLARAWEVYLGTGKPISWWQNQPKEQIFPDAEFELEIIEMPREQLYARCDARFDIMLKLGALQEVEELLSKNYDPNLPIMKAVGISELSTYLRGECSIEEAGNLAKQNTRRYAKRQLTWLRNQF